MAQKSNIEWTEATWNPITGCNKISPGCKNCYAERMAFRLKHMGVDRYEDGFKLKLHEDVVKQPLFWKKPQVIFVNSMSDLFHEDVPLDFIKTIFDTMKQAHWHTFQILTKRSSRLKEVAHELPWPENVWMGVSVENQDYTHRINDLLEVPSAVRFLSIEPLIGKIYRIKLAGIDWVIVGGESGPKARPIKREWVELIKDKCQKQNVPFFFKQWGGFKKKANGRELDNRTWDEMPTPILRDKKLMSA